MQSIDSNVISRFASMLACGAIWDEDYDAMPGYQAVSAAKLSPSSTSRSPGALHRLCIKPFVLASTVPPRPVLLHSITNQACPYGPVCKCLKSSFECLSKTSRRVGIKAKAICRSGRKRLVAQVRDRICEPARGVHDRNSPIFQAVELIEAARLITAGHQEQVGPRLDPVSQLIG